MAADDDGTADTGNTRRDSDERRQTTGQQRSRIRVLHADDAPDVVELNRRHLAQYDDRIELEIVRNAAEGLARLGEETFDCIVSDYEMPGTNGVEFCERVREDGTELPFILYTSKSSETVAGEALSAGVTDYVQKKRGTAHLAVLANRIVTAVESRQVRQTRNRLLEAIDAFEAGLALLDEDGRFTYVSGAYADHVGTDPDELVGEHLGRIYQEIPDCGGDILHEIDDTDDWLTTLQTDDSATAGEHVLVKTTHDGLVCAIRQRETESTSDE